MHRELSILLTGASLFCGAVVQAEMVWNMNTSGGPHGDMPQCKVPGTGLGNYHALIAEREDGRLHESALRYVYLLDREPKISPSELVGAEKLLFEIIPEPYVREHRRYTSCDAINVHVRLEQGPAEC